MKVEVLDVGQGTSVFLRLPGGKRWLIDGGFRSPGGFDLGRMAVAPALWARKMDRLEAVVLSHPHPDHCGGLAFVVEEFRPGLFIHPGHRDGSQMYAELLGKVEEAGVPGLPLAALHRGLDLGSVHIQALWPPPGFEDQKPRPGWYENQNETSLVLKITHGQVRFLFAADIEAKAEQSPVSPPRPGPGGPVRPGPLSAPPRQPNLQRGGVPKAGGGLNWPWPPAARTRTTGLIRRSGPGWNRPGRGLLATNGWGALSLSSDGDRVRDQDRAGPKPLSRGLPGLVKAWERVPLPLP